MSTDINKYISRIRDRLDSIVDEYHDYDFNFKPLLSQEEFEEEILPLFGGLVKLKNKYLVIHEVFSNLIAISSLSQKKLICIVDFVVGLAKHDQDLQTLPNDILRQLSADPGVFQELRKAIFDKSRSDYPFNLTDRKRAATDNVSLAELEKQIEDKKQKRDNADDGDYQDRRADETTRKVRFVVERDLDFLYAKLGQVETAEEIVRAKDNTFSGYKLAKYKLFAEADPEEECAENLDRLLNSFMQFASKRAAETDFDSISFMHEAEYQYIMTHLAEIPSTPLPPLILDVRSVMVKRERGPSILRKRMKTTKVKGLRMLHVFKNEREYAATFRKIVPKEKVAERVEWLNSFITDGKSLYKCDKIKEIMELKECNETLAKESADEDEDDGGEDDEGEYRTTEPPQAQDLPGPSLDGDNDIAKSDSTESSLSTVPVNYSADNRRTVLTSACGIRLSSTHIIKQLSCMEWMSQLGDLLFPGTRISKRLPESKVMSLVHRDYSRLYLNFRPYLMEILMSDLNEFFTVPQYFQLDGVMFQLQIQQLRKKKQVQNNARDRCRTLDEGYL